jgi:glutaredoxin-related protein
MKMMLSEFVRKVEANYDSIKVMGLIVNLKSVLKEKGDIEIDLNVMCKHFGVKIN